METTEPVRIQSIRRWQWAALVLYCLSTVLNFGSAWLVPMESRGTMDADTLLDAAGYAFSIWALVFGGMIWHSWRQLRSPLHTLSYAALQACYHATIALTIAAIATILFVPISFFDIPLTSLADILLHLISLIVAYRLLQSTEKYQKPHWPVSVFLGWISVAMVISTSKTLVQCGVRPTAATSASLAILMIAIVVLLGLFLLIRYRDQPLPLTLAWGLAGIYAAQYDVTATVGLSAAIAASVLVAAVVFSLTNRAKSAPHQRSL